MQSPRTLNSSITPDSNTGLYDSKTLAKALNVAPSTLRTMISRGQAPKPTCVVGRAYLWSKDDVEGFFTISDPYSETRLCSSPPGNRYLPKIIDLFSGCGGMSLGFQMAGFKILAGFDNWQPAIETYRANMAHEAHTLDLSDIEKTVRKLEPYFTEADVKPAIIGGPPCQDFSSAGKRKEGARADLTEKYASIVQHFEPPFFVMENVARAQHSAAFHRAIGILKSAGYSVDYLVIDASRVGVPQVRKRLITVGVKNPATLAQIIHNLKQNQESKALTIREYFKKELNRELEIDHYYRHPRSYARRGVFSIDQPSPTVRGVNRPIPSGYPGHPGDTAPVKFTRPLSTLERASIQTFPNEFKWIGSKTNIEQMIGNAVPVNLGNFIADSIAEAYLESLPKL